MKKKLIIMAMAACLAMGTTEAALAETCSQEERIADLIQKLQQYISAQMKPEAGGGQENNGKPENSEKPDFQIPETSSEISQVINLTNKERAAQGLSPLKSDSQLNKLAQIKAEDMARNGYFSHTSPTYGSAFDMMNTYGISYKTAGENIAKGQKNAHTVMDGWMNSSGHRENILNSFYSEIGVGYAVDSRGTTYWVQLFKG